MLEQDRFASGHQMRCPSCMAENLTTRRFCAQCGVPLPSPCPACGFKNEPAARFCGGCGKPIGEVAAPAPAVVPAPLRADGAERRQLTVMFCDLVGSTPLSTRFDPEDLRGIMGSYHRCVAETVEDFDGFVARYMGDGVLIYFGYPQAHEDDAERAIRCGLAVVDQVPQLNLAEMLHTRIGIATGLVVIGGEVVEHDVVGDTPNLAARLQALAEPDAVVIAAGTHRLVGALFEYRDLGAVDVKGIAGPISAWRVLCPSAVGSRFEALRGSVLSPLVGRDEEIDLLLRRWARAKAGDGQVVLVSGEPGIGKSRLLEGLRKAAGKDHIWVAIRCSPFHTASAFHPIIEHLKRVFGWQPEDTAQQHLAKLEAGLGGFRTLPHSESVRLFADLMSVPLPEGRYPRLSMTAQQQRDATLDAIVAWLIETAERTPVLMAWEDLHWADPTTLETLGMLIAPMSRCGLRGASSMAASPRAMTMLSKR
jgi:class 3 adenylate cyclase